LNVDNIITYEANEFNTIVIRRFDETTTRGFNLNELQLWVNNENILPSNASTLEAYFANWSDNDTPIPPSFAEGADRYLDVYLYNDYIEYGVGSAGGGSINSAIIKNIPPTNVNDIQSILLYHRAGAGNVAQAIGLTIELYNTQDDPNLLSPLATTPVIETGLRGFRYDFPSINTYTLGFFDGVSISQIALETYDGSDWNSISRVDATIFNEKVNINTDATITGDLIVGTTNIITEIGTKQDEIDTTTDLTCNSITTIGGGTIGGNLTITGQ